MIWRIYLVIMIIPSMAEDAPANKIRGRTGYALNGGSAGNESSLTEVSSPFSNIKEGFITEVTYNSGEDIIARLNKKKDLVKFTPALKNLTNASVEMVGEREQKKRRKKIKTQKSEELNNNSENSNELKVRMPLRKRYKIPRQASSDISNKESNENSDDQRENYPKHFNINNVKNIKPFLHTKHVTSNLSSILPAELNGLIVSYSPDFEQIRKGRSESDQSIVRSEFNDEEKGSEQVKKISFPRPVKDLVILKPELKQPKKLVKFEDIVSKQKQLKPEPKPSTTTTEIPVQIKKLNFTRKVEPNAVIASTEQPVKIKKFELNRLNQQIINSKNVRDFTFESERDKSTLNKEPSNFKKYTKPEIKQVPVRTITTSEITIPKFETEKFTKNENQYGIPINYYYEQTRDTPQEETTLIRKHPSLRQSTLQNNFKLIKMPSKNSYPEIRTNPDKLKHEINYDDSADEDFDYSFGFPESKIKFGSKSKNANKTTQFNPVRNTASEVKLRHNQGAKDKKTIGRFKKKQPEVNKDYSNTENYPVIKPRPDFKKHLDDIKTEIDLISKPRPELKKHLEDPVTENYPKHKQKSDLKSNAIETVTENYPLTKPVPKPRYEEAEVIPSNQIVTNENKKRKKLKKRKKNKDTATELLNRLTNTFHKNQEVEEEYKEEDLTYINPVGGGGLRNNKKPDQIDTLTSHYLLKQNPPRINDPSPNHYIANDVTHSPYKLETTTYNYQQDRDINQQSSIEDFEEFLRDLSSSLKVQKYNNPETFNNLPLPTSSTNQVDYFPPSHSDEDWKPITYGYVPQKSHFDAHPINNHYYDNHNSNYNNYNNDQKSILNYNNEPKSIINYNNDHTIDYKLNTNNFDYDYNSNNNYNSQNNDVTLFFDQKGTSIFSSGINDNGQSYYGYRIRSPSSPNDENIFKTSYNRPNNYQNSHHSNNKLNFIEQKPSSFDFNSFVPNHKPSYDPINHNINDKPKTTKSPFFNHNNNFGGTSLFNKPVDGNYVATSHQSLIRLSANDHPLKSYHDFVVHHRY